MIAYIQNGDAGEDVRFKLNQILDFVNRRGAVFKPAEEGRTSNTLTDDTDLSFALQDGHSYLVKFSLVFRMLVSDDSPNISFDLPGIAGNVQMVFKQIFDGTALDVAYSDVPFSAAFAPTFVAGSGNLVEGWLRFTVDDSAGGNVTLKWSNASGAGTSYLEAGSWMEITSVDQLNS